MPNKNIVLYQVISGFPCAASYAGRFRDGEERNSLCRKGPHWLGPDCMENIYTGENCVDRAHQNEAPEPKLWKNRINPTDYSVTKPKYSLADTGETQL